MFVDEKVKTRMKDSGYDDFILEEYVGLYEPGELFKSYHNQSHRPVSCPGLVASYFSLRLKM